jgi:hypothetical protein
VLGRLGPGLIIAGSIVGSGELIATTKTGAQAGLTLLWLILIGCVIKVFVQIELGRYAITTGETPLAALNRVPGPRARVNWIVWYWVVMNVIGLGQVGGIVGGVGQSLALTFPLSGDYELAILRAEDVYTWDDKYWAAIATAATIVLLVRGGYRSIQGVATMLVASFTLLTLGNVVSLQFTERWSVTGDQLLRGLAFHLPRQEGALLTAMAAFGIIGVGAGELIAYPYWCLEKGYARFTGPRSASRQWAERASGWVRVMSYDAYLSMVIYTASTVGFYSLGATVLHRMPDGSGDPEGMRMVHTLAKAYVPVFGDYAMHLFLAGAVAVLYSTFYAGNAVLARMVADAFRVFGFARLGHRRRHNQVVSGLCVILPLTALAIYLTGSDPVVLVLTSGVM